MSLSTVVEQQPQEQTPAAEERDGNLERRNELAMQVDEAVQECTYFDAKGEKFTAWMKKNWKQVDELRGLFPPQGSHTKVSVLGEMHTWDSYCKSTFGESRGWVMEVLKWHRDKVAGVNSTSDTKRSAAAKKANATRKETQQATSVKFDVDDSDVKDAGVNEVVDRPTSRLQIAAWFQIECGTSATQVQHEMEQILKILKLDGKITVTVED